MARYSRYGNHGSKPFPEYSILSNNWLIIYEAISKGRGGNDHLADLVNLSSSITLKCLISEKMIPKALSYLSALGIFNRMPKFDKLTLIQHFFISLKFEIEQFSVYFLQCSLK